MDLIYWFLFFIGHIGFWCVVFNRIHATKWNRKWRKLLEKFVILAVAIPVVYLAYQVYLQSTFGYQQIASINGLNTFVLIAFPMLGVFFSLRWCYRKFLVKAPAAIVERTRSWINVQEKLGQSVYVGTVASWLGRVPFNQAHWLTIERMTFELANLPADLNGLKICQISDLHLTGMIRIEYYDRMVAEVNEFEPDLIVITGDLIDSHPCLDWIDQVFGQLKSRLGNFYVLGNHDRRIKDEVMLRQKLADANLIAVNGKWQQVDVGETSISLTGNELPWYSGAESLEPLAVDESQSKKSLRILLSHSPDQIDWAAQHQFDLMFAGHNHGGQIAFPVIGPIIAPSKYGVLYASGTFQIGKMLMHVSRGLSGDECIRINSPPEIGFFTLRAK